MPGTIPLPETIGASVAPPFPKEPRGTWLLPQPKGRKKEVTKLLTISMLVFGVGLPPPLHHPVGQERQASQASSKEG